MSRPEQMDEGTERLARFPILSVSFSPACANQFIFLGPTPLALLVWLEAEKVFWIYLGLTVPTIFFSCIVLPCWARQDGVCRQIPAHRVRVIQR